MGTSKKQREKVAKICQCGCEKTFYPFPVYRKKSDGGGLRYPKYIRGHHPKCTDHPPAGWNSGLKKGDHPSIERMGYQKGHKPYNDWSHVIEKQRNDPEYRKRWIKSKKGQVAWNKGLKKSEYPNGIASGPNHGNWKGVGKVRDSAEYRAFSYSILERDKFTCQECKKVGGKLEVHHIVAVKDALHLIFDPDNVITLCCSCHKKTPNYGSKANRKKSKRR